MLPEASDEGVMKGALSKVGTSCLAQRGADLFGSAGVQG